MKHGLDWIARTPIAHRGLHDAASGRLENTRDAFQAAIDNRFAIECDVQLTADGEAVVFHDFTLQRLAGASGTLREQSAAQLSQHRLKNSANHIETLDSLLNQVAGKVPLVIEIKSRFDGDITLTRRVIAIMQAYSGPYVLKSFDPAIVIALRQHAPEMPRGIVSMSDYGDDDDIRHLPRSTVKAMEQLLHIAESQPHFVSWYAADLPTAAPFLMRHFGCPLMTWTVKSQEQAQLAYRYADQIVFEGFSPDAAASRPVQAQ